MIRIPLWEARLDSGQRRVVEGWKAGVSCSVCVHCSTFGTLHSSPVQSSHQPSYPVGLQTPPMRVDSHNNNNDITPSDTQPHQVTPSDIKIAIINSAENEGIKTVTEEIRSCVKSSLTLLGFYHEKTNNNFALCFASINSSPGRHK